MPNFNSHFVIVDSDEEQDTIVVFLTDRVSFVVRDL